MLKVIKVRLNRVIAAIAGILGLEVKLSDEEYFVRLLNHHNVDLILDVGANTGQFASLCFALGYKGRIISFEPLNNAYNILKSNASKNANWEVPDRMALGDFDGEIEINIAGNSVSSSILEMSNQHTKSSPNSKYVGREKVKVFKLDTIFKSLKKDARNVLLKVDTQGFENAVLIGASESLKEIKGVQLEMSLAQLYDGQLSFIELYQKMTALGYMLQQLESGFTDKDTGIVLQVDGVFFKPHH